MFAALADTDISTIETRINKILFTYLLLTLVTHFQKHKWAYKGLWIFIHNDKYIGSIIASVVWIAYSFDILSLLFSAYPLCLCLQRV